MHPDLAFTQLVGYDPSRVVLSLIRTEQELGLLRLQVDDRVGRVGMVRSKPEAWTAFQVLKEAGLPRQPGFVSQVFQASWLPGEWPSRLFRPGGVRPLLLGESPLELGEIDLLVANWLGQHPLRPA